MTTRIATMLLLTMTLFATFALFAGRSTASSVGDKRYCYAQDINPYLNFASKTSYEFVYNKKGISEITGCQAVQLWLVSRHGTRFPSIKHFKSLRRLESLRDRILSNNGSMLCAEDRANLAGWSYGVPDADAKRLTTQGRADLVGLGRRVASYFPHLFHSGYDPHIHVFRHTDTPRTAESAVRFAEGVFGKQLIQRLPAPVNGSSDPLLNPYEHCAAWRGLEEPNQQDRRFKKSRWVQEVVDRVAQRTDLRHPRLTSAQVFSMYDGCRYQKAWNVSEISPWCAVFRKEDLEVLEYRGDLREFYKSGPGSDISFKLACPMLQDLIKNFRAVAKRVEAAPSALLYFSHDWGLQMLAARLNLTTGDPPLDADSWPEPASSRHFRTSATVPFAGNIMAVLYKCTEGDLKVGVYHQEHLVRVPGCKDSYCDWQEFEHMFGPIADDQACANTHFCMKSAWSKIKDKNNQ